MLDTDARKLGRKTLAVLRTRAVKRIKTGESPEVVAKALGVHRATVYRWLSRYDTGGLDALKEKKAPGRAPRLSGKELRILRNTIVDKTPDQLKFPFALWTCDLVRQFIEERFDVYLSRVSVNRLLAKLGLSFQKPLKRAYQQDESLVSQWMEKEYPKIKARAKREGGIIFFEDEAGIRSDHHAGKTWAVVGKTPIVSTTGARFGVNMISAISPLGQVEFQITKGRVNSDVFIEFLERLIRYKRRKVFLIVDGHPTHKSKKVKEFLENHSSRIELHVLPPYSPELNPDELVWNDLKNNVGRQRVTGPDDLIGKVNSYFESLISNTAKVMSFFREKHVSYAR